MAIFSGYVSLPEGNDINNQHRENRNTEIPYCEKKKKRYYERLRGSKDATFGCCLRCANKGPFGHCMFYGHPILEIHSHHGDISNTAMWLKQ